MKKIFYWRFSRKIEGEFWIFYKRFPWEKNWMEENFKGMSLKNWIHTRASLSRAVFSFNFLWLWVKKPSPLADDLHLLKRDRAKRVIVVGEVREYDSSKLIVGSESGTTPPSQLWKKWVSEVKWKWSNFLVFDFLKKADFRLGKVKLSMIFQKHTYLL